MLFRRCAPLLLTSLFGCASAANAHAPPPSTANGRATAKPSAASSNGAATTPPVDTSAEAGFTESALSLLRSAAPELSARVSAPLQLAVDGPGGTTLHVNLDRIWSGCQGEATECETSLREYVSATARVLREREAPLTREAILPVVRPKEYLAEIGGPENAIGEPLAGNLWVFYVADSPTSVRSLTPAQVTKLGISRDEVARIARENLAKRLGDLPNDVAVTGEAIGLIFQKEYFESSRMLLLDQWKTLAKRSGGKLFVAVPGNDVLFFGVNPDVAKMMKVTADLYAKVPRQVSDQVFSLTESGWTAISPQRKRELN